MNHGYQSYNRVTGTPETAIEDDLLRSLGIRVKESVQADAIISEDAEPNLAEVAKPLCGLSVSTFDTDLLSINARRLV